MLLGAARVDFGVENRPQKEPQSDQNEHPNSLRRSMRKRTPKHPQSDHKMDANWAPKCIQRGPKARPKTHTKIYLKSRGGDPVRGLRERGGAGPLKLKNRPREAGPGHQAADSRQQVAERRQQTADTRPSNTPLVPKGTVADIYIYIYI